jgi:hypothetical protein
MARLRPMAPDGRTGTSRTASKYLAPVVRGCDSINGMNDSQVAQVDQSVTDTQDPICEMCSEFDGGQEDVRHGPFPKMPKEAALPKLAEFVAGAGLIQIEGERLPKRMSMEMFAHLVGWSRRQLYNWMDSEENWDAQVFSAINKVHSAKRVARVLSGMYIEAAAGKIQQGEFYLRHFWPEYKAPKEEKEHTFTGLADLYKAHADSMKGTSEGVIIVDNPDLIEAN